MKYVLLVYFFFVSFDALAQTDEKILQSNESSYSYVEKLLFFQNKFLLFDYLRVKKYVSKSLEIAEKNHYDNLLPEIYANTGYVSQKEGNMEEAEKYYKQSISLSNKQNNKRALAIALRFYGTLYADLSEYNKSLEKIKEAKSISNALNDTLVSALCLQNIGYVHARRGFFDSSIFYYKMASG